MAENKFDKLLNRYDISIKINKEKNTKFIQEHIKIKDKFNKAFKKVLKKTIRPKMKSLLTKIREHGLEAVVYKKRETKYLSYIQESYLIKLSNNKEYLKITIVGNYDKQKVYIFLRCPVQSSSKTVESSYSLNKITPKLLEKKVYKGFYKSIIREM
jgi:hypothetical protein